MENFKDLSQLRYSCRDYDSTRAIPSETLIDVMECVRLAPSACNRQPWRFYIVEDAQQRGAILAKSRPAFMQAPAVIVAVGLHDDAWHRPSDGKDHTDVDVSIAVEHLCLAASEHGLGTCWVCSFDVDATRQALGLAPNEEPIALIPIGYPAQGSTVPNKNRKPMDEIVRWIK